MSTWSLDEHGSVAVLTFTRPPRNLMDFASIDELVSHLERLAERSDKISVVVLTGGVDGFFVAHADIAGLIEWADGALPAGVIDGWDRATALLEEMPQVTIAAIDGQAWGGGNEIALACTLRLGSERTTVGQPEVRVGLIPGAGGTVRLARLIGYAKAAELILTARTVDAEEAYALGWLTAVLPTSGYRLAAIDWAQRLTRFEPPALFAAKRALLQGQRCEPTVALRQERELFARLAEHSEALRAWTGPAS